MNTRLRRAGTSGLECQKAASESRASARRDSSVALGANVLTVDTRFAAMEASADLSRVVSGGPSDPSSSASEASDLSCSICSGRPSGCSESSAGGTVGEALFFLDLLPVLLAEAVLVRFFLLFAGSADGRTAGKPRDRVVVENAT